MILELLKFTDKPYIISFIINYLQSYYFPLIKQFRQFDLKCGSSIKAFLGKPNISILLGQYEILFTLKSIEKQRIENFVQHDLLLICKYFVKIRTQWLVFAF
jgi:hypothetical protein